MSYNVVRLAFSVSDLENIIQNKLFIDWTEFPNDVAIQMGGFDVASNSFTVYAYHDSFKPVAPGTDIPLKSVPLFVHPIIREEDTDIPTLIRKGKAFDGNLPHIDATLIELIKSKKRLIIDPANVKLPELDNDQIASIAKAYRQLAHELSSIEELNKIKDIPFATANRKEFSTFWSLLGWDVDATLLDEDDKGDAKEVQRATYKSTHLDVEVFANGVIHVTSGTLYYVPRGVTLRYAYKQAMSALEQEEARAVSQKVRNRRN